MGMALHLNKFESSSPKDALCQDKAIDMHDLNYH